MSVGLDWPVRPISQRVRTELVVEQTMLFHSPCSFMLTTTHPPPVTEATQHYREMHKCTDPDVHTHAHIDVQK